MSNFNESYSFEFAMAWWSLVAVNSHMLVVDRVSPPWIRDIYQMNIQPETSLSHRFPFSVLFQ